MEIISNKNHQLKEKIVRDINRVNPNLVIDVGCGSYWSKPRIQNVVGFDQTKWKRNSLTNLMAQFQKMEMMKKKNSLKNKRQKLKQELKTLMLEHVIL